MVGWSQESPAALASWVDQVQGSVSSQRKCRTVLPEFVPPKRHWARLPRVWYAQSLPAFVILPPGLRTEKPCVISELFETMVAGSFMTSAEMVALLVTVSEVVTAPSGYFTVMVDSSGFCQNHLS